MKIIALLLTILAISFAGDWEMFSDGEDTYIYNTRTGDIYIRHKGGKENYKDEFIKMPQGKILGRTPTNQALKSQSPTESKDDEKLKSLQQEALKKSQDLLQNSFEF